MKKAPFGAFYAVLIMSFMLTPSIILNPSKFSMLGNVAPDCHLYMLLGVSRDKKSCICATVILRAFLNWRIFSPVEARSIIGAFSIKIPPHATCLNRRMLSRENIFWLNSPSATPLIPSIPAVMRLSSISI